MRLAHLLEVVAIGLTFTIDTQVDHLLIRVILIHFELSAHSKTYRSLLLLSRDLEDRAPPTSTLFHQFVDFWLGGTPAKRLIIYIDILRDLITLVYFKFTVHYTSRVVVMSRRLQGTNLSQRLS